MTWPPKTGADGVAWESLIEIRKDEPLIEPTKSKRPEPKPPQTQCAASPTAVAMVGGGSRGFIARACRGVGGGLEV